MSLGLHRFFAPVALGAAALALGVAPARAETGGVGAPPAGASQPVATTGAAAAGSVDVADGAPAKAGDGRYAHRAPEHAHRIAFGMGFLLGLTSQDIGALDFTDGGEAHSDPQLSVAFGSQLAPTWVIGLRMAYAAKPFYSDARDHSLWQLAAEARWQPEGELGPYAVGGAGGVASVDDSGGVAAWELAPAAGGALGFDVALSGPVTLGFELRALAAMFRTELDSFTAEASEPEVEYGISSWLGFNVIATLGVGEGGS